MVNLPYQRGGSFRRGNVTPGASSSRRTAPSENPKCNRCGWRHPGRCMVSKQVECFAYGEIGHTAKA
ncbi:hypothetical protein HPP92_026691 [Vanilla planifolia]|uniref:Uncharacterized protein n=1 Tax=Vanilla planifolia TaxID=51239 RepID=A0A835PEL3_VANPL|nr:hypothetical protein HPP92_026691 [Vanilla planifolia]